MENIWIFNHHALPPTISGGTRHYDISNELVKKGYKVTIFSSSYHYSTFEEFKEYETNNYQTENISGVNFVWVKTFPYKNNGWRRLINMFSYVKNVKKYLKNSKLVRPDIIIGSTVHLLAVNLAYKIAKKTKSKFYIEVRDFWPYTLVALGKIHKFHPLVLFFGHLEKKLYPKANKIITLFDNGFKYLEKYTDKNKIVYLPNSFNTKLTKTKNTIDFKIDKSKFIVMYTGAIGIPNDLFTIIYAFEKISEKNIELHIVGDGKQKQKIEEYIKVKKLGNIIFHNPVPKNQIQNLLSKADVLWAGMQDSKLYEFGFSFNKIYDYMAAGKPIILSSNVKNNIIHKAQCGIVISAENPTELQNAILKMYDTNIEDRNIIGQNGNKFILENITTEIITQQFIDKIIN